jgi:transcriptional regulator with XRE-family HTH domain
MPVDRTGTIHKRDKAIPLPRFYLTEHRLKLGLSVEEVSRALNLSHYYYYQLESGRRGHKLPIPLVLELVRVLEIDAIRFLKLESEHVQKHAQLNRIT